MKKLLIRSSLFVIITLVVSVAFMFGLNRLCRKPEYFKLNPSIETIFAGHSHIQLAINDSLVRNSINIGQSGESYVYTYQKLKAFLKHNPQVKTVVLECTNNALSTYLDHRTWGSYFMTTKLPKFNLELDNKDFHTFFDSLPVVALSSYPIAAKLEMEFLISGKDNFPDHMKWGGYYYYAKSDVDSLLKNPPKEPLKASAFVFSEHALDYISKIAALCKSHNVNLLFFRSPLHSKWEFLQNENMFCTEMKNHFPEYQLLDFKSFPLPDGDFRDLAHLNYRGARKLSVFVDSLVNAGLLGDPAPQSMIDSARFGKLSGCGN